MAAKRGEAREYWTKVLAELAQSGLKHREFAAQRNVSLHAMRVWRYKLRREERKTAPRKKRALRLLPVRVRRERPTAERSIVELAISGVAVRFAEGTSVRYIAELARALRERC